MIYHLHELLSKMGAPEVREKSRLQWHYCDADTGAVAGFADIRLEAGGERLVAELEAIRSDDEKADSPDHAAEDRFHLLAERTARPDYFRVLQISFDGETYTRPSRSVVELGLSLFHARALDISIRMVEQTFNKRDMLDARDEDLFAASRLPPLRLREPVKTAERFGVVIPFRPRAVVQTSGL